MNVKLVMDEVAETALNTWSGTKRKKEPENITEYKAELEEAKQKLENAVNDSIKPGVREWVSTHLGRGKMESFIRRHVNRLDALRKLFINYEDAVGSLHCGLEEEAFLDGFKAGIRFRSQFDTWAKSEGDDE